MYQPPPFLSDHRMPRPGSLCNGWDWTPACAWGSSCWPGPLNIAEPPRWALCRASAAVGRAAGVGLWALRTSLLNCLEADLLLASSQASALPLPLLLQIWFFEGRDFNICDQLLKFYLGKSAICHGEFKCQHIILVTFYLHLPICK